MQQRPKCVAQYPYHCHSTPLHFILVAPLLQFVRFFCALSNTVKDTYRRNSFDGRWWLLNGTGRICVRSASVDLRHTVSARESLCCTLSVLTMCESLCRKPTLLTVCESLCRTPSLILTEYMIVCHWNLQCGWVALVIK